MIPFCLISTHSKGDHYEQTKTNKNKQIFQTIFLGSIYILSVDFDKDRSVKRYGPLCSSKVFDR